MFVELFIFHETMTDFPSSINERIIPDVNWRVAPQTAGWEELANNAFIIG